MIITTALQISVIHYSLYLYVYFLPVIKLCVEILRITYYKYGIEINEPCSVKKLGDSPRVATGFERAFQ